MCFSSPKPISPPAVPTAIAAPEQAIDTAGQQASDSLRKRLRALSGYASTSLTGGAGATGPANVGKTTLGG